MVAHHAEFSSSRDNGRCVESASTKKFWVMETHSLNIRGGFDPRNLFLGLMCFVLNLVALLQCPYRLNRQPKILPLCFYGIEGHKI